MAPRILTGQISHETNTFSKLATNLDSFRRRMLVLGNEVPEALRGTRTAIGAAFEAADQFGWTLSHPLAAAANPSGMVTSEAFEQLTAWLLAGAEGCQGALIDLHGAMVTEDFEDAEGEILARLRSALGPDAPIVVTLDLHGNITTRMAENASALIAVRTYPHIDYYERAWQGARLLDRALRGEIHPRTVIAKRPMLRGLDGGQTQSGPMRELIDRGEALEKSGAALVVSVCAGFPPADIRDTGPSVTVTTDADAATGHRIAEEFMDYAWETRDSVSARHASIADAVAQAQSGQLRPDKPLVLADVTDNPGSGHYGDTTNLLRAMIAADLRNAAFYAIFDPVAVADAAAIGVGRTGRILLGGKHDALAGGAPLELEARVVSLTDGHFQCFGPMGGGVWRNYGPSALLRVGGVAIAVISNNGQANDLAQLISLGVDPLRCATIAVKSNHHFRAAFEPIARAVVTVNGGGLGASIDARMDYRRVRRPIWPLDSVTA